MKRYSGCLESSAQPGEDRINARVECHRVPRSAGCDTRLLCTRDVRDESDPWQRGGRSHSSRRPNETVETDPSDGKPGSARERLRGMCPAQARNSPEPRFGAASLKRPRRKRSNACQSAAAIGFCRIRQPAATTKGSEMAAAERRGQRRSSRLAVRGQQHWLVRLALASMSILT